MIVNKLMIRTASVGLFCLGLSACASMNGGSDDALPKATSYLADTPYPVKGQSDMYMFWLAPQLVCGKNWTTGCNTKAANKVFTTYMTQHNYKKYNVVQHAYCVNFRNSSNTTMRCLPPEQVALMDEKSDYTNKIDMMPGYTESDMSALYKVQFSR